MIGGYADPDLTYIISPQNPSIDVSVLHKICRSTEFKALKL